MDPGSQQFHDLRNAPLTGALLFSTSSVALSYLRRPSKPPVAHLTLAVFRLRLCRAVPQCLRGYIVIAIFCLCHMRTNGLD